MLLLISASDILHLDPAESTWFLVEVSDLIVCLNKTRQSTPCQSLFEILDHEIRCLQFFSIPLNRQH